MIEIKNDVLSLGVLPETGGSLSYFKYMGTDILRPSNPSETESNQTALFPMLPYASFIQEGHFPYLGITRHIDRNCSFSRFPLHGDVWRSKLQITSQTENSVILSYTHDKKEGFPFSYKAEIEYKLNGNRFQTVLTLKNEVALPMPYGMGIHPFFIKDADTKIQFDANKVWFRGDDPILGHPYTVPNNLNFKNEQVVSGNGTNVSFGSWDGKARISYPNKNIAIEIQTSNAFRHLILYAPKGKDFFCLEPVTNTPDAFNLASLGIVGTGIQSLGPKQSISEKIEFILKGLK
ncbi:MAG: aldose 1-epimerase [Alphaproteobacteria bacterium]|nr:aldose 1-epimerase [Alphaproteobacteria bacterium]